MLPLSERLKKGAKMLGECWRIPEERCPAGWSLDSCECKPKRKFCKVRLQWLTLAVEDCRELEDPFGLAMAMTASEWDATGVALKVEREDTGIFTVGTSEQCVLKMAHMAEMMEAPEALLSTLRVMKAFPNANVQGIEIPKVAEEALAEEVAE